MTIPTLGLAVAVAISILNVLEGLALSIPLVAIGVARWKVLDWATVTGLPQPFGAVLAFVFGISATWLLPRAFGFAAGALFYLVVVEFVPAGLAHGRTLDGRDRRELGAGLAIGFVLTSVLVGLLG